MSHGQGHHERNRRIRRRCPLGRARPPSLRSDQRLRFTAFFVGKLLASMMKPPSSRACDHLEPRWAQLSYFAVLQPKLDISRMESVVTSKSCHFLERLYFLERHIRDAASQFVRI